MARVVGVVGASASGKTTLASALIPALRATGVKVGYLEHAHAGFEVDRPDLDSGRLHTAGADPVVVIGPDELFTRERGPVTTTRALARLSDCDLVLAEGFHDAPWPKILLTRDGGERRDATPPILAELHADTSGRCTAADIESVTALLVEVVRQPHETGAVTLRIDGEHIPLSGFAAEIIAGTVRGMVATLKGVHDPDTVELTIGSDLPQGDL